MSGGYSRAVEEARKELAATVPAVVSASAGVSFEPAPGGGEGVFRVPFLDREIEVSYPEGVVREGGRDAVVAVSVVVLHYLARSAGPLDLDDPVRFQGFPGAGAYVAAFRGHAEVPLLRRFGEDPAAYVRAARALGGAPLQAGAAAGAAASAAASAAGDDAAAEAIWRMPFLPHLPLGVRLGLAADGLPAECVIVFPRRAGYVYHVEDLAVAGEILSARILGAAGSPSGEGDVFSAVPTPRPGAHETVVLAVFYDPVEAEIVLAKLRSAGIEATLRHDALSTVYGLTLDGHGKNEILVRRVDLPEARAALAVEEA